VSWRKLCVEGLTPVPDLHPICVRPQQAIAELNSPGSDKVGRGELDLEIPSAWAGNRSLIETNWMPLEENALNQGRRLGNRDLTMSRIDRSYAGNGRKPKPSIAAFPHRRAGGGRCSARHALGCLCQRLLDGSFCDYEHPLYHCRAAFGFDGLSHHPHAVHHRR